MKNIYIYPNNYVSRSNSRNPYVGDLIHSLSLHYTIVNKNSDTKYGILSILRYIKKTDIYFFNWIEDLPEKRFGILQSIALFIILLLLKLLSKKIIWTVHNRVSHSIRRKHLKKIIFSCFFKYSNIIITHSLAGVEMLSKNSVRNNIYCIPHPIKEYYAKDVEEKKYDVLIWGAVYPYKGIDLFLQYIYEIKSQNKYKILIIGNFTNENEYNSYKKYANNNIRISNKFIAENDLIELIASSKIVLFTYKHDSVLSSGALCDSLRYGAYILGPNISAFRDYAQNNLIQVYNDYSDLITKLNLMLKMDQNHYNVNIKDYITKNTWLEYGNKIKTLIDEFCA